MMHADTLERLAAHKADSAHKLQLQDLRNAFTLIEILVTLFILMILTSIALPMTRNIIRDQRNARAAQVVLSFIDSARNQAIAENRETGVMLVRMANIDFGRSASVNLRQLRGLPAYTGETAKAEAILVNVAENPGDPVNAAWFDPLENQLLLLSAEILNDSTRDDDTAPIRPGDRLEFPGGRIVTIRSIYRRAPLNALSMIVVTFDLREPYDPASPLTARTHPQRVPLMSDPPQRVRYAIHRSPLVSNTRTVSLPRGTAIDFNYSGFGVRGNEFAPNLTDPAIPASAIEIHFDGKGRVSRVRNAMGSFIMPVSQLFFCLGDLDGVRPDNLFDEERRSRANILRSNSSWIVINPATGRVSASPFAAVTAPSGDFTTLSVNEGIEQARFLANIGDTSE